MRGELRITSYSDNPARYAPGGILYLEGQPHKVLRSFKVRRQAWVLRLEGIRSLQGAEALRDKLLTVPSQESPPPLAGSYYHHQLLGIQVHTQEGEFLGRITDILTTGGNDVYVVSHDHGEILIPAIKSVIKQVNLDEGVAIVNLPEGLR